MRLKRPEGLNIIPFIDIMLVLLAIVLTISTFVAQQSIKVKVPETTQGIANVDEKSYEIIIKDNEEIYFQNTNITFEELSDTIAKLSDKDAIVLKADVKSEFGTFVQIIDLLKKLHKDHVNIVVKKD